MARAATALIISNGRSLPTSVLAAMCLKTLSTPLRDWTQTESCWMVRNRYVLHFTKADIPPVRSARFLVAHVVRQGILPGAQSRAIATRCSLGMSSNENPDGSMDLYVQKNPPGADKEPNWLPAPDGEFIPMLRLYWPKDEVVNGVWVPPPVRRIE